MSLAEVHFMVLGWREIHVASLGEDQLSLGATAPPRAAMAEVISSWRAGKRTLGGSRPGLEDSSASESESESTSASSRGGGGWAEVGKEGSQSSSSSSSLVFVLLLSSARMMPSSCIQEMNSGVKGTMRERMQEERYLGHAWSVGISQGRRGEAHLGNQES